MLSYYHAFTQDKLMTIAAIQMCSSHKLDDNLQTAAAMLEEAARQGARLAVLPEMFAIMGMDQSDKISCQEPFGQGPIQDFLSKAARDNQIWIVGGTIPLSTNNPNKVRAASLVFNDQGECVARYDKIHLFDVVISNHESYKESNAVEAGDEVIVIDTPLGKLGLAVCYDLRFPELFRSLVNKGAEIIVIPAAFTLKTGEAHLELLARARAIENFCYVLVACQGGRHSNQRETYGHSLIIEPWGSVVTKANIDPCIIYSKVDLEHLYKIRKAIPVLQHQKLL